MKLFQDFELLLGGENNINLTNPHLHLCDGGAFLFRECLLRNNSFEKTEFNQNSLFNTLSVGGQQCWPDIFNG